MLADAPPAPPRRRTRRTRRALLTPNMIEDLMFMAQTGEDATGAAARISRHTESTTTFSRDRLLELLRKAGHGVVASRLIDAEPLSEVALADSDAAARSRALREARAEKRRRRGA